MGDKADTEGASSSQVSSENSESSIEINIKTLDSQIYTFRVDKNMPLPMLKEKIADVIGIPIGQQRLIYRGKVLKDEHCLSEYQLEDGHTLHLVERQPVQAQDSSGTSSQESARINANQGNGSTAPAPPNRVGQISHSVVLGTLNLADQGGAMVADISRLVGSVLNSLGVAASNIPTATTSNQVTASPETGVQNASGGAQAANMGHPGFTILNQPIQVVPQLSQSPPLVSLSRPTVIHDALTTISEFINRMDLALQSAVSQSSPSPTNVRELPRSDVPFPNQRGLPTPEMLGLTIERAQQLLRGNAATVLSQIAARLEREGTSTDPVVRNQIQTEAMYTGAALQHLGALLLELGRTTMTLHMGPSPAESWVNAGPAVYISSTGPNPIMVQPFPLQTSSIFSTAPPVASGGTLGTVDPSRNVNIHIHTGASVAPGISSAGAGAGTGDASSGERPNIEPASTNGNSAGDARSTRGLPSRTVVAAIPARSAAETRGHVLSVVLPVQVRSQQSIPVQPGSSQVINTTGSSGGQSNASIPTPNSSQSNAVPTLIAQINARIASAFAGNALGQSSISTSMQPTEPQGSHLATGSRAQTSTASPPQETTPGVNSVATLGTIQGQGSSSNVPSEHISRASEETEVTPSGPLSSGFANSSGSGHFQTVADAGAVESLKCPDIGLSESQDQPLQVEALQNIGHVGFSSSSGKETSNSSSTGVKICQAGDGEVSISSARSSERNSPLVHGLTQHSSDQGSSESDRPAPLGLGLGGLQPKRRGKTGKPTTKADESRDMPSVSHNQPSIARGQHVLQSLVSQRSDMNRPSANGSATSSPVEQVDIANMMSQVLQNPSMNSLLTGVAEQAGVGSSSNLRNMLEQFSRNPAINNVFNNIVQQVEGQGQDIESMVLGSGRGQGGIDFSSMLQQMMPVVSQALGRGATQSASVRSSEPHLSGASVSLSRGMGRGQGGIDISSMIQQMMPVVSQVLGRGSMHSATDHGGEPDSLLQGNGDEADSRDPLNNCSAQVDLQEAIERIEQQESPMDVFRAELESAARLDGEENGFEDLVEELSSNTELIDEFKELLRRHIQQKLQGQSKSNV